MDERTAELAEASETVVEKAARLKAVLIDTVDTQEQERQRIAHDLHDGVGQLLIGAMLELTSAEQRIAGGQLEAAAGALSAARSIVSQVESELRRVVFDLHPPVLEGLGLAAAVRDVVERFGAFTGLHSRFEVFGRPIRLDGRTEIGLYRVAQEALGNVATHAQAKNVAVALRFGEEDVEVEVSDDGVGFDPADTEQLALSGHFGLEGMRRRIDSLGGRLCLETSPTGTTVRATVFVP